MLDFKITKQNHEEIITTSLSGKPLLTTPQLNKGTAFSYEERREFGLFGKLPPRVETLEEQIERAYEQYCGFEHKLDRNQYLQFLHDTNTVLFYKLVSEHLEEMLPIIYTPIVGQAVQRFSHRFRQARGLYIAYPERARMEEILNNRSNPEVDIIVVTDGESILGIGDQGIGGMDIPIAKLMVYTLCAGIHPLRTLPIQLDVGTDNPDLLNDPLYLGWRHERVRGSAYDEYINIFIHTLKRKMPNVFLHWEDFGRETGHRNLLLHRDTICSFNDDIQGTGAVTLAALIAAVKAKKEQVTDQRFVIFGAGSAGIGITEQIVQLLCHEGLTVEQARQKIWLIDRPGLLTTHVDLTPAQQPYARPAEEVAHWPKHDLFTAIRFIRPTVLIGCSTVAGAFTEAVVKAMAAHTERPIIFPLSNPTERAEATPEQLLNWTEGKAIVATGSPFSPVHYQNHTYVVPQCNNALIFPGIGLGVLAAKAKKLTDTMLFAASLALSESAPAVTHDAWSPVLPPLRQARIISPTIALAVAQQAQRDGVAQCNESVNLAETIAELMWEPRYPRLVRA